MNKEEQKEQLYQTLLQRNQYNAEAIKKFRRRASIYFRRPHTQGLAVSLHMTQSQSERIQQQQHQSLRGHAVSGMETGRPCLELLDQAREPSVGAHGKQEQSANGECRQEVKLPLIGVGAAKTVSELAKISRKEKIRKDFSIRMEVSLSLASTKIQSDNYRQQKILAITPTNEINPRQKMPYTHSEAMKLQNLLQNTCRNGHTQVCPSAEEQAIAHIEKNLLKTPESKTQPNSNMLRRQHRPSQSHKAILNMQQIKFDKENQQAKPRQPDKSHQRRNSKTKLGTATKYRKFEFPALANPNHLQYTLVENMSSIANIVNSLANKTKQTNSLSTSQQSPSPSPLSCININNVPQTLLQSCKDRRRNEILSTMPLLSHAVSYTPTDEPALGKAAYLPQIRKLKEFKVNFHRLAKLQSDQHAGKITKDRNSHNHSFSYSNLGNQEGRYRGAGVANQEQELRMSGGAANMLKVQAMPLHQIKYIA